MLFKFYEHTDIKIKHAIYLSSILKQTYIEQIYFEAVKVPNDIEQRTIGQMKVTDSALSLSVRFLFFFAVFAFFSFFSLNGSLFESLYKYWLNIVTDTQET